RQQHPDLRVQRALPRARSALRRSIHARPDGGDAARAARPAPHPRGLGAMRGLLSGKRAIVTGGSRGLGRAICATFAEEGARVAFTSTQPGAAVDEALAAIAAAGGEGRWVQGSATDAPATEAMVREIERSWGGVDVLVNNAGVSQTLPLALIDEADFDHVMSVNVKGVFLTSKAVLRGMIRCKAGVILNVGSLVG